MERLNHVLCEYLYFLVNFGCKGISDKILLVLVEYFVLNFALSPYKAIFSIWVSLVEWLVQPLWIINLFLLHDSLCTCVMKKDNAVCVVLLVCDRVSDSRLKQVELNSTCLLFMCKEALYIHSINNILLAVDRLKEEMQGHETCRQRSDKISLRPALLFLHREA